MRDWKSEVRQRLENSGLDGSSEAEMVEELAQHADDRYHELRQAGEDEETASRIVRAELGHMEEVPRSRVQRKGSPRGDTASSGNWLVDLWRDLRYGARSMRHAPLFSLFAVLTLALGIGANTTVFTVINSLILHPLPVADASQLAIVYKTQAKTTGRATTHLPVSYADFTEFERRQRSFSSIAAYLGPQVLSLRTPDGYARAFGVFVSGNYFETLGITPVVGRFIRREDVLANGSFPVAVISYNAWKLRFQGSDPLGRTVVLNGTPLTIIGVAPRNFLGLNIFFGPDFWIPATMGETILPTQFKQALSDHSKDMFQVFGRLRPGTSVTAANSEMDALSVAVNQQHGDSNDAARVAVRPLLAELRGGDGGGLVIGSVVLLAIVGLLLAVACANVANLQLARGASRSGEIAVRIAMGARPSRLVRQFLAESLLLSLAGCAVGSLIGYGGCRLLWSFLPSEVSANLVSFKLDPVVWFFTVGVSLATVFLFGLVPAVRATKIDVLSGLKQAERSAGQTRRTRLFTQTLLAGQVAFSLVCLATAVLVFRSVQRAYNIDPGFDAHSLSIYMMNPEQIDYDTQRAKDFYREVRERVSSEPGVVSASWANGLPFWNSASQSVRISGAGEQAKSSLLPAINFTVDVGYFRTMQIPLQRGRVFQLEDDENAPPVAIINQQLAKQRWPGGDALGKDLQLAGENQPRQVVGIVRTANYTTLGEGPQNCVYVPLRQKFSGGMTLYVRATGAGGSVIETVQRTIRNVDPAMPVTDTRTGDKLMDDTLFSPRMAAGLLGIFGSLALLLASAGLYGAMAYAVKQREKEMGVRMALGATALSIIGTVLRQGFKPVFWGLGAGLLGFVVLGRLLSRLLFGIAPLDPLSLGAGVLSLLTVAFVACYLPALTATRVDPSTALR
jgi:predicted permease